MSRIARVFPSRTTYTPDDDLCFFDGPGLFPPEVDEVHVSCTFSWDKPRAEQLAEEWSTVLPVKLGGPAYNDFVQEFEPGMYLKKGMTITSRGCPHKCKSCLVPIREGALRTIKIKQGDRLLDSNILACPDPHIKEVFKMLASNKGKFGLHGGFDIRIMKDWHVGLLAEHKTKIERLYIAFDYDSKLSRERTVEAIKKIRVDGGLSLGQLRCFVLIGHEGDTVEAAEDRCQFVFDSGAVPFASVYRGPSELNVKKNPTWQAVSSRWSWMPGIFGRMKREGVDISNQRMMK
jgi:hypothetical protein